MIFFDLKDVKENRAMPPVVGFIAHFAFQTSNVFQPCKAKLWCCLSFYLLHKVYPCLAVLCHHTERFWAGKMRDEAAIHA